MPIHSSRTFRSLFALLVGVTAVIGTGEFHARAASDSWNPAGGETDDPWTQIEQFHNQMDKLFAQSFDQPGQSAFSVPNMDLRDATDRYVVTMDMPGANQESIKVDVQGQVLSVSAERDLSNETKNGDKIIRDERSQARFERALTLPGPVKAGAMKTTYANGVLTIELPKSDEKVAATTPTPSSHAALVDPAWAGFPPGMGFAPGEDPLNQMEQLHNRMDQLFADTFSQSDLNSLFNETAGDKVPSLDLRDEKDRYVVTMDMPGADKGSLKIEVKGRYLSVSGRRDSTNETKQGGTVIQNERSTAEFERNITLPGPVKANAVDAKYANGVLTLNLPKDDSSLNPTEVTVH